MDYKERYNLYLKSEKWALKRKQKAEEQHYICEECGKHIPKGFHIHHKSYANFENEPMCDLQFLCEDCHTNIHCKIQIKKSKPKLKKTVLKSCKNCYYSQIMKFKCGKKSNNVLWCNRYCKKCENETRCQSYRKGIEKKIKVKTKTKKNNKRR